MFSRTGAMIRRFANSIVFVLPVSVAVSSLSVAENATSTSPPGTNLPQLLTEQGWRQTTDADGNTIIYLPAHKSETQSSAAAASTVPPDVETLLRERGWRMETEADGTILLAPTGSAAAGSTEIDTTQVPDPFLLFRQALKDKGWRVEPAEGGALIIYPPLNADPVEPLSEKQMPCQEVELEVVANGTIELPVDNQNKARKLAAAWIDSLAHPGLAVGKVRQINRVYAVSIVEAATPHRLRNQLIIRSVNGRVIVID